MWVTFGLPIVVLFPSNPCLIRQNHFLLLWCISLVCHHWFSPVVAMESIHFVCRWRGGGFTRVGKIVHRCARKIILAQYLFRQAKDRWRVPVCILFPQGTGELISRYHPSKISIQPLIQPQKCEMGSSIFLPWVDSNSWVQLGPPSLSCHQQK